MHFSIILALVSSSFAAPALNTIPAYNAEATSGRYIVKLKGDVTTLAATDLKASLARKPKHEYSMSTFRGFAGTFTAAEKARLEASDLVEYIQPDTMMHAFATVKQANATWGLARLSSRTSLGSNATSTYSYDNSAGADTCAYIIDSGVLISHPEFEGRAQHLTSFSPDNSTADGVGHGTHVAGTIASKTYGVAKKARILSVKVLDDDGSATTAIVLKGIQYVVNDAKTRKVQCKKGLVANISLGGSKNKAVNDAVKAMVEAGIFVAVAAGNEATDAGDVSPASEPSVCTVGATMKNDTMVWFSNFGPSVDVFAPGVNITSLWLDNDYETISGTSMASPHVAGLGAYLLGLGRTKVEDMCETIREMAIKDVVEDLPEDTENLLAYNGVGGAGNIPKYGLGM